jgi:hypothetical protein
MTGDAHALGDRELGGGGLSTSSRLVVNFLLSGGDPTSITPRPEYCRAHHDSLTRLGHRCPANGGGVSNAANNQLIQQVITAANFGITGLSQTIQQNVASTVASRLAVANSQFR